MFEVFSDGHDVSRVEHDSNNGLRSSYTPQEALHGRTWGDSRIVMTVKPGSSDILTIVN